MLHGTRNVPAGRSTVQGGEPLEEGKIVPNVHRVEPEFRSRILQQPVRDGHRDRIGKVEALELRSDVRMVPARFAGGDELGQAGDITGHDFEAAVGTAELHNREMEVTAEGLPDLPSGFFYAVWAIFEDDDHEEDGLDDSPGDGDARHELGLTTCSLS